MFQKFYRSDGDCNGFFFVKRTHTLPLFSFTSSRVSGFVQQFDGADLVKTTHIHTHTFPYLVVLPLPSFVFCFSFQKFHGADER